VSSIWTPSGEHSAGPERGAEPGHGSDGEPTPEEVDAELRRTRAELAAIPVADIVANHAVGLWQLAILHLSPDPAPDGSPVLPQLLEASLAIDALGALVDALGPRLAPHDDTLREAVTQLRLAFVQVTEALDAAFEAEGAAERAENAEGAAERAENAEGAAGEPPAG
jgi:hypothetical protein